MLHLCESFQVLLEVIQNYTAEQVPKAKEQVLGSIFKGMKNQSKVIATRLLLLSRAYSNISRPCLCIDNHILVILRCFRYPHTTRRTCNGIRFLQSSHLVTPSVLAVFHQQVHLHSHELVVCDALDSPQPQKQSRWLSPRAPPVKTSETPLHQA